VSNATGLLDLSKRLAGFGFIVTSIICMTAGFFILNKLATYSNNPNSRDAVETDSMPAVFRQLIDHPSLFLALCVPALVGGVVLLAGAKPRSLWFALCVVTTVIMFGTLMAVFIFWIAPLYQYQDLS
jgi:hypothetical protein